MGEKEQNMDMSEMMQKMKNMYGYDKDFTMNDYKPNKFDMMKRMNEKSYENKSYKDLTILLHRLDTDSSAKLLEALSLLTTPSQLLALTKVTDFLPNFRRKSVRWRNTLET